MKRSLVTRQRRAGGFSLVELMIAIALSLLLSAAIALLYSSNRASARHQSQLARTAEAGRNAMYVLGRSVRQAGFLADPTKWQTRTTIFPATSRPVSGTEDATTALLDRLSVSYQGSGPSAGSADNRIVSCTGAAVPYPATATTVRRDAFWIANDATSGEPTLYCGTNAGTNGTPLVSGIEKMQILYGEDTDNPGDLAANRYVKANEVTNWYNVVSVRLSLVARSPEVVINNPVAHTFDLAGTSYTAPADGRVRQVFTTVINVRNLSD